MKIGAVIVTYNPDIDLVANTVKFLINNNVETVIVDNASKNKKELMNKLSSAFCVEEKENVGIAKALNDGVKYLVKHTDCDWVLTLDQDSIMAEDYFEEIKVKKTNDKIAVYFPMVTDRNQSDKLNKKIIDARIKEIQNLDDYFYIPIQSGAFIKIEDYYLVGGMDESLFIDGVDFDFFLEIIRYDKKMIGLKNTFLYQTVGDKIEKKLMGRAFHPTNHSPIRYYYTYRNFPILIKRHRDLLLSPHSSTRFKSFFNFEKKRVIKMILGENNKLKKLKAMYKGYHDRKILDIVRKKYM
ncbi:glycosyltransferase [Lactococcus lactis]|uniref:Glycosyltransferase n=1 Tax=Lactococcus lactis TaxID=1358 RepID=A0A9X4NE88_9LACT|nr:glycosyltransferase [Lactococcus lactis]MDG4982425.1 glycosyltransferase [Lactococcus lactis]